MIAKFRSRSIRNPYFGDFWEAMTWIMSKSLALLQWGHSRRLRDIRDESGLSPDCGRIGSPLGAMC